MRHRYLRPSLSLPEIYLYRAPVDFRKQAQGLAVLVEQELGHNPFTGALTLQWPGGAEGWDRYQDQP